MLRVGCLDNTRFGVINKGLRNPINIQTRGPLPNIPQKCCRPYLKGRKQLINFGAIVDKKVYEAYEKQRGELTNKILGNARVIYCTCTSLRNRALHQEIVTKDKKERVVVAWPATICIIDEAGYTNPLQVIYLLIFRETFNPNNYKQVLLVSTTFSTTLRHLVLAGDHKQLPAFKLSDEAKKL